MKIKTKVRAGRNCGGIKVAWEQCVREPVGSRLTDTLSWRMKLGTKQWAIRRNASYACS